MKNIFDIILGKFPVLFLTIFFTACPSSKRVVGERERNRDRRPPLSIKVYFPLQVGELRVYRTTYGKNKQRKIVKVQVVRKDGNSYYDSAGGVFTYTPQGVRGNETRYLLKYPLKVGNRWLSVTGITNIERYQIISTDKTVSVPAGTFKHCIVVKSTKKIDPKHTLVAHHIYAPYVGLIKMYTVLYYSGREFPQFTIELIKYVRGKGNSFRKTSKNNLQTVDKKSSADKSK